MNKRMWLQSDENEPTWCEDKLNDDDVEYIRADINAALLEVAEQVVREYEDGLGNMPKDIYEGATEAIRKATE